MEPEGYQDRREIVVVTLPLQLPRRNRRRAADFPESPIFHPPPKHDAALAVPKGSQETLGLTSSVSSGMRSGSRPPG